jgi:hypothetical protein
MAKAKINQKKLVDPIERGFQQTMFALGRSFTEVISQPGAFPSSAEDLVDTGRFRASQRLTFPKPGKARFSWNTEYAIYLLKGYTTRSGTKVEGRDWVAEGLQRSRVGEEFKKQVAQELS